MSDPCQSYVSLLLHCDGADNSTSFPDASIYHNAVTAYGNAAVKTAQSKFGGASLYLDGTGDYLSIPDHAALEFGGADMTVELWLKTAQSRQYTTLLSRNVSAFGTGSWSLMINYASASAGDVALYLAEYNSGFLPILLTTGVSVLDDAWHHIAWTRSRTNHYLFVDGVRRASRTGTSLTIADISAPIIVGNDRIFSGRDLLGYLDEIRITNGFVRYTADFTPPSSPFDDPAAPTGKVLYPRIGADPIFGGRHRIASTVDRLGVAGPYPVRLYHRASGRLIRAARSDAAGNYAFDAIAYEPGGYFAVAHDTNGDPLNAAIADLLTPVPM